ncbi:MAG: tricarboxylic transporter [Chloroflexi bacterium]|jgi:putative tricarboxylic transport membrane protein|nr:tricarboxylic transporter [Chloroflexota bacterium]MCH2531921.1 tripartite tricarboxylate transporter permease [Dehalococcoidia bacterium]HCH35575.1 tricarboxylic transporter [Dehalococcoidia bacterium]|tara:strand:+ start:276 stop:1781 length:1506 start_codon:yes stop_codon:yes gene_type:complete
MIEAMIAALANMSDPAVIAAICLGTLLGVIFGVIPGLGSVIAMTLIMPFTFGWDPIVAMYVFAGIIGTASTGGAVPAILLNTPGTIANVCTTFDGFPMTRRGEGGRAIGLAATASGLGTLFSIVVLAALLPVAKLLILWFTPPDFFWMVILGLIAVTFASRQNMVKGLAAGGVGILLSLIGFSSVFGVRRYTLGSEYLWDGIEIVPLVIGFFALSELMVYTSRGGTIAQDAKVNLGGMKQILRGALEVFQHKAILFRGSIIGTVIGSIPGAGGAVANFLSYSTAKQASKNPELFGTGHPAGVVASESANDAKDGGILLPTLTFGIPGNGEMVILMAAFILHGIQPGRDLLVNRLDIVWAIILGVIGAQILTTIVILAGGAWLAKISLVPVKYIAPFVAILSLIGVYAVRSNIWDVLLAIFAALVGFFMRKAGFPLITLIIGFVLGHLAEEKFTQSLQISQGDYSIFFTRPVSIILLIAIVSMLGWSLYRSANPARANSESN